MPNYHKKQIQSLTIKMLNGNLDAKNQIIIYYTHYIVQIIKSNFNIFDCDEEALKNNMIKVLYDSIDNYTLSSNEYFSHYVTRRIFGYYSNELRKLEYKQEYKNREIQKLAIKMLNGDIEALNKIIEYYSYHIKKLANTKYKYLIIDEVDLIQIGMVGLAKAIELYKKSQIFHFCTYANTYINNEIEREISIRNKEVKTEYIGLFNNYNKMDFINFIEYEEVKNIIQNLSITKQKVLYLYLWQQYTFKEIGNILGFTEANAHLHYQNALKYIKKQLLNEDSYKKML